MNISEVDEAVERDKADPTGGRGTGGGMDRMLNGDEERQKEVLKSAV